jgi:hypothetical protein
MLRIDINLEFHLHVHFCSAIFAVLVLFVDPLIWHFDTFWNDKWKKKCLTKLDNEK